MFSSGLAFVLFKALIGFGLPIAFGLHQLHLLKKDKERNPTPPAGEPAVAAAGEPSPAVVGEPGANQNEPAIERAA